MLIDPSPDRDDKLTVCQLDLTAVELAHIRDLMSVLLPPLGTRTLSQELAISEGRPYIDVVLFEKVYAACKTIGVPTGANAPDFGLVLAETPSIIVTRVQTTLFDETRTDPAA